MDLRAAIAKLMEYWNTDITDISDEDIRAIGDTFNTFLHNTDRTRFGTDFADKMVTKEV